jgi:hypothetical protein
MAHSSNRDRIARAAEEARLTALEKATKKASKPAKAAGAAKVPGAKRSAKSTRVKMMWEVCTPTGTVAAVFAYQDKPAAEAKLAALTKSAGRTHWLRGTQVPME